MIKNTNGKNYIEVENIRISCDTETSERYGGDGTFQVEIIIIETELGELDATSNVDQGKHYYSLEDVVIDLGFDPKAVNFEEY